MKPHTAEGVSDGVYFGLMSGTSMDGVDGVAARFAQGQPPVVLAEAFVPFSDEMRTALFALQQPGDNEVERAALMGNALAMCYASCCDALLCAGELRADDVRAIGAHGQTIRHRPEQGYTRQIINAALLAELTQIDVVTDFRSRDVAAGGQGAPLVPAFHATLFGAPGETRVVCNLGGISNITILPGQPHARGVRGFDCGPANVLVDAWASRHLRQPFDEDGQFAARGQVDSLLLEVLLDEPFFMQPPPKSTGRDLFSELWLNARLRGFEALLPADVQATLVELTAVTVAREIKRHAPHCQAVYVCGGGARNPVMMAALARALAAHELANVSVATTAALGVPPQQVEALAFAWLAQRCIARQPGNLAAVTGAAGERVLGAIYPR